MTTKRASLFGTLAAVPSAAPQEAEKPAPTPAPVVQPAEPGRRYPVAKTREGKRVAGVYLDEEALVQLKTIALRERTTVQALMQEAVNGLFEARGLSRIA